MKKLFFFTIALSILSINMAQAAPNRGLDEFGNPISGKSGKSPVCQKACPGYATSIVECPNGYELKTCEETNCYEYHICEKSPCLPGYDTRLKDCPIAVQPDNYLCSKCK